jgi:hypothetical protein
MADLVPGRRICTPAVEELARVLQKVDDSAVLGQSKGGVRFRGTSRVHAYRDRGKRGSRETTKISSSLHNKN